MDTLIKFALAQLEILAGHPDVNVAKILSEIGKAKKRKVDVILFSEMAVPGYLLGDEWENESFIRDLMDYNQEILKASEGIVVIWGNVYADFDKKGEDGRTRKYNAVYIAQDGHWVSNDVFEGHTFKTLLPKYREFDDERHFYSMVKLAHEQGKSLNEILKPFSIKIGGQVVKLGAILCEDMWCDDYTDNPTAILVKNGAEIIINLSCSPWTWRKNDKRHRVVKSLLSKNPVPFLYCNNVGTQNNGKNIFLFDGNSTVYNKEGELIKQAKDYTEEVVEVEWSETCLPAGRLPETRNDVVTTALSEAHDIKELYDGLVYGLKHFFQTLPSNKVIIGLSGGIDSAVSASLLTAALGSENVFAVNMPSIFNSELTRSAAEKLAKKLGINYAIFPIQPVVDLTIKELESVEFLGRGTPTVLAVTGLVKENIQARDRGSRVLASIAASLGAVFVNNGNKTETALGYATLYGDVDGAIAPLADLYKSQIYELAKYINGRGDGEIIPKEIVEVVPSAELSKDQDVMAGKGDPILYPYHDKLLRAFIEFRLDPKQILELYLEGNLEKEIKIEEGLIKKYFPSGESFVKDLEHKWRLYKMNYFKRVQAPPIIAVSKRAFGFDLRESQNGVYFTRGYIKLKEGLINQTPTTERMGDKLKG